MIDHCLGSELSNEPMTIGRRMNEVEKQIRVQIASYAVAGGLGDVLQSELRRRRDQKIDYGERIYLNDIYIVGGGHAIKSQGKLGIVLAR